MLRRGASNEYHNIRVVGEIRKYYYFLLPDRQKYGKSNCMYDIVNYDDWIDYAQRELRFRMPYENNDDLN